jgi:hypothetical protein
MQWVCSSFGCRVLFAVSTVEGQCLLLFVCVARSTVVLAVSHAVSLRSDQKESPTELVLVADTRSTDCNEKHVVFLRLGIR